jgi:DNA-binding Lrp family transcriptional regulator
MYGMNKLVLLLSCALTHSKVPPPEYRAPVCRHQPCFRRKIRTTIVIEDSLWQDMQLAAGGGDPTQEIVNQLEITFEGVNRHLEELDNGGFVVDFGTRVTKLADSGIRLENSYVDRLDRNKTRRFERDNIFAHTFTFQEAVEKLPDRHAVDLRILVIPERGTSPTLATSEETCICNRDWFGCVAIFSIRFQNNWSFHQNIFAHEIGHALGMDLHDDQFYAANPGDKLLMWSSVGRGAFIWSPEAKQRINTQDNSCLRRVQLLPDSASSLDSSAVVFPDD